MGIVQRSGWMALAGLVMVMGAGLLVSGPLAAGVPEDPYRSPMWEYNIERYLGEDVTVRHSDQVQMKVPDFAEDSAQVPLTVELSGFAGEIREIITWVDLNPIPHLFTYQASETRQPRALALNFRVQQATTVRAAVRDQNDVWYIGSARVDAAGGGCTAPSETAGNPNWEEQFGRMRGGAFSRAGDTRLKLSVMHPMDSGMVGDIPAFHIEQVEVREAGASEPVGTMVLSESASENPMFVFDLEGDTGAISLWLRDNNANVFERTLGAAS